MVRHDRFLSSAASRVGAVTTMEGWAEYAILGTVIGGSARHGGCFIFIIMQRIFVSDFQKFKPETMDPTWA